jgi:superfamily I DNA/RNA helicase
MLSFAKCDAAMRAIQSTYNVISRLNGPFTDRIEFLRRDNNKPVAGALVLTTMHSAKGLEWDHVWITRAEEGSCLTTRALSRKSGACSTSQ